MFDLDNAVNVWTESVFGRGCGTNAHVHEVQDHLHEEIGRLQQSGLSQEQAFHKATEKLGSIKQLKSEYAKNKGIFATLCAIENAYLDKESDSNPKKSRALALGHSLLFAIAMIVSALIIRDSDVASTITNFVLLPLWFMTFLMIPGIRHSAQCELQYFKRVLGRIR